MNLPHAFALMITPGGRALVAHELRREELTACLAAVTGDPDAATVGPLADEAARRQQAHDRRVTTRGTIGPHDPLHGLESVYRDVCAGILYAENGAWPQRILLGPEQPWIPGHLWDAAESPTVPPLGDRAYPDDPGTGCWKTIEQPDGSYGVCNADVPDDDPLGLCPTHANQLRSDA